jgi:hypothetical protein
MAFADKRTTAIPHVHENALSTVGELFHKISRHQDFVPTVTGIT